jgi:HEAT repeat protein
LALVAAGALGAPPRAEGPKAGDARELEKELRAPRPETRRAAVKKLGELATRPAWELVLGALEDEDPMVADEAQLLLASATEPAIVQALHGPKGLRARDPWVRLRVAEVFGRMRGALDGLALARAVDARDEEVARTLLWSLERRIAARDDVGDKERIAKEVEGLWRVRGAPEVRGRALIVLEKLDHFRARPLIDEAAADRDPRLRCAALVAARGFAEAERLERAQRALLDPEPSVRSCAIGTLCEIASRPALLELVHRLEIEPRERLRWRIVAFLRARSGLDHGLDVAAWRAWAATVEGPWTTGPAPLSDRPVGTGATLAGLRLVSDRVCFLVDFSGSTWDTKVRDRTRKQVLDAELRKALEALPPATRFNVIPYTNEPLPWEKELVPATKENVARALAWFERSHARGRGNFYDAALLALADPEVDCLVALTDGVPTGGHRWNMGLMVELLVERGRFRQAAFDSILVDAPKSRVHDWTALAERTGGRCVTAVLE